MERLGVVELAEGNPTYGVREGQPCLLQNETPTQRDKRGAGDFRQRSFRLTCGRSAA